MIEEPRAHAATKLKRTLSHSGEKARFITLSGLHTETYALVLASKENGGWIVSRWGRADEPDNGVYYVVRVPAKNRAGVRAWCTCRGFFHRGVCRHQHLVSLARLF